ncbi:MAG TPA: YcxB family protein, partial [Ferruginibacter sp.]|nr:YcxB family protein [Ferruginibacter sp.]
MTSEFFTYDKKKVIQALRYHFITRREIRVMMILINVFALLSAALFFFKRISPYAFLISSLLWIMLMLTFWFILPYTVYRRADTFRDRFRALLSADTFR